MTVLNFTSVNLPFTASHILSQLPHVRTALSFSPSSVHPQLGHRVAIKVKFDLGLS
jgi:hypothetical protein